MDDLKREYYEILGMAREYINYQKMCGVDYYPHDGTAGINKNERDNTIDMEETLSHELHNINTEPKSVVQAPSEEKRSEITSVLNELSDCKRCKLSRNRTKLVFGEGNLDARLVFVGEAPGRDEDLSGLPFVGRAGKLLTKIIEAMNMTREDVYIMNIVKCRPPENRNPEEDEIRTCEPFMLKQLSIIKPEIICTLGTFSSQTLLKTSVPISKLRGHFHDYHGIKLMPTYHPAFLLRNASKKKEVWEDMQAIMKEFKG